MKKPIKLLAAFSMAGYLLVAGATGASAQDHQPAAPSPTKAVLPVESGIKVETKAINEHTDLYKAVLNIPAVQGLKDTKYQDELNKVISSRATEALKAIKEQAEKEFETSKSVGYPFHPYEVILQYEVKAGGGATDKDRFSISVTTYTYTGGAHGITRTDNYNTLNEERASRISLENLFGSNYKTTIDSFVQGEINKHPDSYFKDTIIDISAEQSFYIESGQAVIQFAPYEIAPYAAGALEFRLPIPGETPSDAAPSLLVVGGNPISAEQASVFKTETGVTMVPLRITAEALGYAVTWNEEQSRADVSKSAQFTYVTIGQDAYVVNKIAPFPLGEPPILKNDKTYVPLAFFSDVLKAKVTTRNGKINIDIE